MNRLATVMCLGVLAPSAVSGQSTATGFLDRVVAVEGMDYRYQVYVPSGYDGSETLPVILFLHGAGERGSDGLAQTTVGLGPAIRSAPDRFPAIVVMPQVPRDSQWVGQPAEAAMLALHNTMSEYRTDPTRVYLTGLSMGGHGTWYLGYRHANVFAAIAPICGWIPEIRGFRGSVPIVDDTDGDPVHAVADRLRGMPTWIFHGEMDGVVPVTASRQPAAALREVSTQIRYTEFLGTGHNSWDAAYASDEFVEWLFAQRRR